MGPDRRPRLKTGAYLSTSLNDVFLLGERRFGRLKVRAGVSGRVNRQCKSDGSQMTKNCREGSGRVGVGERWAVKRIRFLRAPFMNESEAQISLMNSSVS